MHNTDGLNCETNLSNTLVLVLISRRSILPLFRAGENMTPLISHQPRNNYQPNELHVPYLQTSGDNIEEIVRFPQILKAKAVVVASEFCLEKENGVVVAMKTEV